MTAALIDALGGFQGVTIRVRHPLPPASMRLLDTLGASVEIDPSAPPCVRLTVCQSSGPDRVSDRMCSECRRIERAA